MQGGSFFSLLLVYHNQKHISMQKEKSLRPTAGRFGMRSAFALRIFSGKNIYNFAILENLRIFQNCLFTGGVVTENGICSAAFCESAALRLASSPSQALTRQIPPFVTRGDIFPRSGGSLSSKGEPLAKPVTWHLSRKLYRHAKASPFGRGGSERSELTERARLLPRSAAASAGSRRCKCRFPPRPYP